MQAVVVGGSGFIGGVLCRRLAAQGATVCNIDLTPSEEAPGRFVAADDEAGVEAACASADSLYLLASRSHISATWAQPEVELHESLAPVLRYAGIAAEAGIGRIVLASSGGAVYGARAGRIDEETLPTPITPYGVAKLAAEGFLRCLSLRAGLRVDVYRIANVYGPGQPARDGQGVVAHWLRAARDGEPIRLFGDRNTTRDLVHVDDVADRLVAVPRSETPFAIWNVGTGTGTTLARLLEEIEHVTGRALTIQHDPERTFDVRSNILDGSRLEAALDVPTYRALREGLRSTWADLVESTA